MTQYDPFEPYIVGIDFDGTITSSPLGGYSYPEPSRGFYKFYEWCINNDVFLCIHTARDLSVDLNYNYIIEYLSRYGLDRIYLPKRDGKTLKSIAKDKMWFPYSASANTKIPCSCFVDDMNIGIPKRRDGSINWRRVRRLIKRDMRRIARMWEFPARAILSI